MLTSFYRTMTKNNDLLKTTIIVTQLLQ